jgi:hypothetical protein
MVGSVAISDLETILGHSRKSELTNRDEVFVILGEFTLDDIAIAKIIKKAKRISETRRYLS